LAILGSASEDGKSPHVKTMAANLAPIPTEKQVDELSDFLDEHCCSEGNTGMSLSMLDGYLTAIASGPETPPTHEWLPAIFGATDDAMQRLFDNAPEQAARIRATIFGRFNEIGNLLGNARLSPIVLEDVIDFWCLGYVRGIGLRQDTWSPLLEEERAHILAPIMLTSMSYVMAQQQRKKALEALSQDSRRKQQSLRDVPRAAIMAYCFLQGKYPASTPLREKARPGRNEPCLCGSGKKYKKCCI
jgi:uncharacterized protein